MFHYEVLNIAPHNFKPIGSVFFMWLVAKTQTHSLIQTPHPFYTYIPRSLSLLSARRNSISTCYLVTEFKKTIWRYPSTLCPCFSGRPTFCTSLGQSLLSLSLCDEPISQNKRSIYIKVIRTLKQFDATVGIRTFFNSDLSGSRLSKRKRCLDTFM